MRTQDQVIDRIQKLLRLSKSTSDAEAALAAQRASELMAAHHLTEALVRAADDTGGAPAEVIIKGQAVVDPNGRAAKKKIAWKGTIAHGVAHSMGCRQYWHGPAIMFFGRASAVAAASYTAQYLWREVDRLAEAAYASAPHDVYDTPRIWKGAFRHGAAGQIAERLHAVARDAKAAATAARQEAARVAHNAEIDGDATKGTHRQALVLLNRDAQEVEEEYATFTKGFRSTRIGSGRIRSWGGYGAGQAAGRNIHLGGGRAALGRGPGRLKGGR